MRRYLLVVFVSVIALGESAANARQQLVQFGIYPRSATIYDGETITLVAWGAQASAPDKPVDITNAVWQGDKPRQFRATAADVGKSFRVTASTADGVLRDTAWVRVDRGPRIGESGRPIWIDSPVERSGLWPQRQEGDSAINTPAGYQWVEGRRCIRYETNGAGGVQEAIWTFTLPEVLTSGHVFPIEAVAQMRADPPAVVPEWTSQLQFSKEFEVVESSPGLRSSTGTKDGRWRVRLDPLARTASISVVCGPGGAVVTYQYGEGVPPRVSWRGMPPNVSLPRILRDVERTSFDDGLGRQISLIEPNIRYQFLMRLDNELDWALVHVTPHEETLLPVAVKTSWVQQGARAGRLIVEAPGLDPPCTFEGDILADRVTVTGEARCLDSKKPFRAQIVPIPKCNGFDGKWYGTHGEMTLTVAPDGRLTGTFGGQLTRGRITGRLRDSSSATGTWSESDGKGTFEIRLSPSGARFTGSMVNQAGGRLEPKYECTGPRP
jgi:hypothetical protein